MKIKFFDLLSTQHSGNEFRISKNHKEISMPVLYRKPDIRRLCKVIFLLFLSSTFLMSYNIQAKIAKTTIAVLPFTVGNFPEIQAGDVKITPVFVEKEFSNQLITFLVKSRKFNVLDRESVKNILDENKLTESEWAKPGQRQKIGKLLVADYLVTGNIARITFTLKNVNIKITGEQRQDIIATLKISFHVTEVASGKIVFSDTITERVNSTDVKRELPFETWKDWTISDYRDLLFTRTVEKAGNAILAGIFPIKIISVKKEACFIIMRFYLTVWCKKYIVVL